MAAQTFEVWNGPSATTSAPVAVTTGTATKTMLQLYNLANNLRVVEWGVTFATVPTAFVTAELISTSGGGTVTAYVANDITALSDPMASYSTANLSLSNSGYTATAEGSVSGVRQGDLQCLLATQYLKQFPAGREFEAAHGSYLRIRLTTTVAISATCYVIFEV